MMGTSSFWNQVQKQARNDWADAVTKQFEKARAQPHTLLSMVPKDVVPTTPLTVEVGQVWRHVAANGNWVICSVDGDDVVIRQGINFQRLTMRELLADGVRVGVDYALDTSKPATVTPPSQLPIAAAAFAGMWVAMNVVNDYPHPRYKDAKRLLRDHGKLAIVDYYPKLKHDGWLTPQLWQVIVAAGCEAGAAEWHWPVARSAESFYLAAKTDGTPERSAVLRAITTHRPPEGKWTYRSKR